MDMTLEKEDGTTMTVTLKKPKTGIIRKAVRHMVQASDDADEQQGKAGAAFLDTLETMAMHASGLSEEEYDNLPGESTKKLVDWARDIVKDRVDFTKPSQTQES